MLRPALLTLIASVSLLTASAQSPAPKEKSDPEAKKILDRIRQKYESYKSMEATFTLTIEIPESPQEIQNGTVAQDGDKFRLTMADQEIVSDAKTTWVYLKANKEIQIDDAQVGDQSDFLTPRELLNRYQRGDFLYTVVNKYPRNGKQYTDIEFKPVDRNSEYSKLRLSVVEKTSTIESVVAFARDGSRYTFTINRFSPNKSFPASYFSIDPKDYPGVHVEDLRF